METSGSESGQIPLILIHGAWLSALSWENYSDYFANGVPALKELPNSA